MLEGKAGGVGREGGRVNALFICSAQSVFVFCLFFFLFFCCCFFVCLFVFSYNNTKPLSISICFSYEIKRLS